MTNTKLITPSAYAKSRGLNRSTICRQIRDGKIPTVGGMIDPTAADIARDENLNPLRRKQVAAIAEPSDEFISGAKWLAQEIITGARRSWPTFVATLNVGDDATKPVIATATIFLVERWLAGYVVNTELPPIDWRVFGDGAKAVGTEAAALMAEWRAGIAAEEAKQS